MQRLNRLLTVTAAGLLVLSVALWSKVEQLNTTANSQLHTIASMEREIVVQRDIETSFGISGEYAGEFFCTAYCTEKRPHICGTGDGITASGVPVTADVSVAVDPSVIPLGTWLYIEGVGVRQAQDIGGGVKGNSIDVAVDTHEHALKWTGYGNHKVYILKGC